MTQPSPTPGPLLKVEDLAITFRNRRGTFEVCSDVGLELDRGEALALVGESGSGKTVTVLAIAGLLGPGGSVTRGRIVYGGRDVAQFGLRERRKGGLYGKEIGVIFQNPALALDPVFTIGQQLTEALRLTGDLAPATARERGVEWLSNVGLPEPRAQFDRYPHQLSGGQKQRAMVAVALASEPKLLIADEPTTALDVTIQAQVLRLIRRLQRELNLALLMVTHDFGVVSAMADSVAVMYAGEVVETGRKSDIIADPHHPYTKGLLASLPRAERGRRMQPLAGSVPTASSMPSGCRFHPRCPSVFAPCDTTHPHPVRVAGRRDVRCLLYETEPVGG